MHGLNTVIAYMQSCRMFSSTAVRPSQVCLQLVPESAMQNSHILAFYNATSWDDNGRPPQSKTQLYILQYSCIGYKIVYVSGCTCYMPIHNTQLLSAIHVLQSHICLQPARHIPISICVQMCHYLIVFSTEGCVHTSNRRGTFTVIPALF